jgi:hypothetical protein
MPVDTALSLLKLQSFDLQANSFLKLIKTKAMSVVHWARNALVRDFLKTADATGKPCTHLLFMDADMDPPMNGLLKLMECDADIAAGLFTSRGVEAEPVLRRLVDDRLEKIPVSELPQDMEGLDAADLIEVDATGMAFTLIKRRVFETLLDPWFEFDTMPGNEPYEYGEDVTFCLRARKAGFKVVVRPDCVVGHIGTFAFDIRHSWAAAEAAAEEEVHGDRTGDPRRDHVGAGCAR